MMAPRLRGVKVFRTLKEQSVREMSKSKKQTKKQSKKAKPQKVMKIKSFGPDPSSLMGWVMGTCSVTNPFCPEAKGARWPDNSFTRSVGWGYQNQMTGITTNVSGTGAVMFTASLFNTYYGGVVTGTTSAYGGSGNPGVTPAMVASRYRVTTWGLRLNSTASAMTATGVVTVRLFSPQTMASLTSVDIMATTADASYDIPLSRLIGKDAFVFPMPLGTNARLWESSETASAAMGSTVSTHGWQTVQVALSGAPASSVPLNIYMYYNFEIVPVDGDGANVFSRAPPMSSPVVREANAGVLERIGNFVEGTAEKVDKLVQTKAFKYLAGAFGTAAAGPQGGQQAFMLANVAHNSRTVD